MLHAYELGMLSDADREAFEMHMMDCRHCFERAQKLAEAANMVRHDPEVHSAVEQMDRAETEEDNSGITSNKKSLSARKLWRSLVPSIVVVGLLILLILKPWQIDIHTTQEAVATQPRLAIMYFENLTDPEDTQRLSDIITSLMITDLSESQYVSVISSQRLYDIARAIGKEGSSRLDRETAMEIAQRADAEWMLIGSIHQTEPNYSLAGQLVEVSTGDVIASQLVAGEPGDKIFALVDKLTIELKNDLALPSGASMEPDRMVAEVTTHSPEAYRYYIEGVELFNKYYIDEAKAALEKAIEKDSTFAMAYYALASMTSGYEGSTYMEKAIKYLDRVNQKERYYILSLKAASDNNYEGAIEYLENILERYPDEKEAIYRIGNFYYVTHDYSKAIVNFERVIELDPFNKVTFNMLAYSYYMIGKYDRAVETIDKYVAVAPDEANPYDSRGDILSRLGRYDEAMDSYRKAAAIKPDFSSTAMALFYIPLFQRKYEEAEHYAAAFTDTGIRSADSRSTLYQSILQVYQGRFDSAIVIAQKMLDKDKDENYYALIADKLYLMATIYESRGKYEQAVKTIREARKASIMNNSKMNASYRHIEIIYLVKAGRIDEAEELLTNYGKENDGNVFRLARYHYVKGVMAMERADYDYAISELEQSSKMRSSFSYLTNYMLARAHSRTGNYKSAIPLFEQLRKYVGIWRIFYGVEDSKAYYYLGIAYEETAAYEKAIKQYEDFLVIWKDADSTFNAEIEDAQKRLAQLKSRS